MNKKALIMLSGGLDSRLAAKLMLEQGVELIGVNFISIFCTCTTRSRKAAGCISEAQSAAKELGIPVRTISKGMDYFKIVENPKYGYGKGMNPCIDCRIYMLKKAKAIMHDAGASFIVTGEVLGQRPMSQQRHQLEIIERESGLEGLILRPLSAPLLRETVPEKTGIVDRQRLLSIHGRSRKKQIKLAEELEMKDYPCPSGGCLLTDRIFSRRLKDLFTYKKDYTMNDLRLLKLGRHFRIDKQTKLIIGRNREENHYLELLANGNPVIKPVEVPGPSGLLSGVLSLRNKSLFASLIYRYSDVKEGERLKLNLRNGDLVEELYAEAPAEQGEIERIMI